MCAVHHLYIDLETYSDIDIGKAGLFRYTQSPAFQILLFAYSLDGHTPQVIDFACGEQLPAELYSMLFDKNVIKHAFNAAFEWRCLSTGFKLSEADAAAWLPQWRCSMIHAAYCGYPMSLAAAGKALGLPEDQQKLSIGKALIRYFCSPCAPTRSNGQRCRNLPHHDNGKWELFKTYNAQDVTAEMEIERRLSAFPVSADVQKQWETDQVINLRGVAVDMPLVDAALDLDAATREEFLTEARRLTGLDNPNSLAQLRKWIKERTGEDVPGLTKDTVEELLSARNFPADVTRVLQIRQELSKTSTKKYDALKNATGEDGRVRGLLQFYGANRTGRWAGRIVQPQNLPRTYIKSEYLPLARDLVKNRQKAGLELVFGSVSDTLSQLIRTALIAAPGHTLVDADFSAIEARLIAWLAGEEWALEVFRGDGKIYEAVAAQMFHVPVERIKKGNPEYAYRQKGKVATLALGYQGGAGALVAMGALKMGIPESDLPDIVERWRASNSNIVQFWTTVDGAAREAVSTGRTVELNGGRLVFAREMDEYNDFLTVRLPSGRKLYYPRPSIGADRWGRASICYLGQSQNNGNKWAPIETYGGKIVENVTQAVARDCLADAIERLNAARFPIVFHIHDEVVIDAGEDKNSLDEVIKIMSQTPAWAPGLPLNADGWVNPFFKKE